MEVLHGRKNKRPVQKWRGDLGDNVKSLTLSATRPRCDAILHDRPNGAFDAETRIHTVHSLRAPA